MYNLDRTTRRKETTLYRSVPRYTAICETL